MPNILTPLQAQVLQLLFDNRAAEKGYFLTGGTALGAYYLQHRTSDDLDLFNRSPRPLAADLAAFQKCLEPQAIQTSLELMAEDSARFWVFRQEGERLKIELATRDKVELAPVRDFSGIRVDSLEDIAVNKVCALFRQEPKDYVDLYFILTETSWTLEYLLDRARLKDAVFDEARGLLRFADSLSLVGAFALPQFMRRPLNLGKMEARLQQEAEKIRERLRPGR